MKYISQEDPVLEVPSRKRGMTSAPAKSESSQASRGSKRKVPSKSREVIEDSDYEEEEPPAKSKFAHFAQEFADFAILRTAFLAFCFVLEAIHSRFHAPGPGHETPGTGQVQGAHKGQG